MRLYLFLLPALLLGGCSIIGNLGQLKSDNPQATDFRSALAAEYLAYSESESEQGHFLSSEHFAGKGLKVLKGDNVEPEPVNHSLPAADRADMEASRETLLSLLNDKVENAAPQKAARAQIMFDCLQQQDKRHASETVREKVPCEDEFASSMADLQEVADSFIAGSKNTARISFSRGSDKLTAHARQTIATIAKNVSHAKAYAIQLEGHETTQSGDLIKRRIEAVRQALIAHGVAQIHIHVQGLGSTEAVRLSNDEPPLTPGVIEITVIVGKET